MPLKEDGRNLMNILKQTRISLSITQDELSALFGITRRQLVNLENGKHQVKKSLGMLCLMLKYFDSKQIHKFEIELSKYEIKGDSF